MSTFSHAYNLPDHNF